MRLPHLFAQIFHAELVRRLLTDHARGIDQTLCPQQVYLATLIQQALFGMHGLHQSDEERV